MSMPAMNPEAAAFFRTTLPADPRVQIRPMFGHLAGFAGGHMFAGVFGSQLFVRLPEPDRAELLALPGAAVFAPMAGRPMKEYVTLPADWQGDAPAVQPWFERALTAALAMEPKQAKPKRR